MGRAAYIQVNALCMIMLTVLLWSFRKRRDERFLSDQRIFEWMLIANITILLFDSATALFDGLLSPFAVLANRIATVGFYSLNPVVGFFYILYCEKKLNYPASRGKRRAFLYLIPVVAHLMLVLWSLKEPIFFSLGPDNVYRRGDWFILSMILSFYLPFHAFAEVIIMMRKGVDSQRSSYAPLLAFPVIPILGAAAQFFTPDMSVIWVSVSLSMLVIFISLQNAQVTSDPLTGLFNRGQLGSYLRWKTGKNTSGMKLYLVMLDLDDFKSINDRLGHITGDDALIRAAKCLRAVCQRSDFVARYGGDEFVLVVERRDGGQVEALIQAISRAASKAAHGANYKLTFSMGYAAWSEAGGSIDRLIDEADKRMYWVKSKKKLDRT